MTQGIANGSETDTLDDKAIVSWGAGCTGTFIHPHYILTAAHCFSACTRSVGCVLGGGDIPWQSSGVGLDGPVSFDVRNDVTPTGPRQFTADWVWFPRPEDFGGHAPPDVAILHTREYFAGKVIPVLPTEHLPTPDNVCDKWQDAVIQQVGYSDNQRTNDTRRRQGLMRINGDVDMNRRAFVADSIGAVATCKGDSGGPTLWNIEGRRRVGGVISYGTGDCLDEDPFTGMAFIPRPMLERIAAAPQSACDGLSWDACVRSHETRSTSSSAAAYYPRTQELDVVRVLPDGSLGRFTKTRNFPYASPVVHGAPGLSASEGGSSTIFYPPGERLESYFVDRKGAVNVLWQGTNGDWHGPFPITPGLAPPGAQVAAVYYPKDQQLEVFVVGSDGRLYAIWKSNGGTTYAWTPISPEGWWTLPGSRLSATYYPYNDALEVFTVGGEGRVNVTWKSHGGGWSTAPISEAIYGLNSGISSTYYPVKERLEVFAVDLHGRVNVIQKAFNNPYGESSITEASFATPGTPVASAFYPFNNQLELVLMAKNVPFVMWTFGDERMTRRAPLPAPAGTLEDNARIDLVFNPNDNMLEAFIEGRDGTLNHFSKSQNQPWQWGAVGPFKTPPPATGAVTVYEHADFRGLSQALPPGTYDVLAGQLTIGNDRISSVRVPVGYTITLYADTGFGGVVRELTRSAALLVDFNDQTTSIKVETSIFNTPDIEVPNPWIHVY